jgi:hypothetical protein
MFLDPEKDYEVKVRCPDHGEVWARVVDRVRTRGVSTVACPRCPEVIEFKNSRGQVMATHPGNLIELHFDPSPGLVREVVDFPEGGAVDTITDTIPGRADDDGE